MIYEPLIVVARKLAHLRSRAVFVGGMVRGLLISDVAAGAPRATKDVDLIAGIASRFEFYRLREELRRLTTSKTSFRSSTAAWNSLRNFDELASWCARTSEILSPICWLRPISSNRPPDTCRVMTPANGDSGRYSNDFAN